MLAAAALGAAGTALLGGAPRGSARARQFLDVSQRGTRTAPTRLRLTLDKATGKGDAVPLVLGTSQDVAVPVTVSSTTGRTTVADRRWAAASRSTVEVKVSGTRRAVVWVTPRRTGEPMAPGDRLTVSTPHGDTEVEAWVAPVGGEWRPAEFQGEDGFRSADLGIVAMHAAHMRSSSGPRVVMWSPPRFRDEDGDPLPDPQRPGQWQWYKFQLGDVESRTLDVTTATTRDTPVPALLPGTWKSPGTPRRDNLFCAGAAHLPDGRLLVAGGHVGPFYTQCDNGGQGGNADHLHVFDPEQQTWRRLPLPDLRPYVRWYPSVTALPDGRMLIASGSRDVPEGMENYPNVDAYWDTINNNYVIFDPVTETIGNVQGPLIDERKLGLTVNGKPERLATYPGVFVLPGAGGGTIIAMAETNRGWLYTYEPGAASPLQLADRVYPMLGKGSRSYPTYGSMVLLPLTPDQQGEHTVRILAVGGQGSERPDHRALTADQPSTSTAEILEVDTTAPLTEQKGWRVPRGKHLRHSRVLCDATLLADGTVLVSGGSTTGWGDNNRGPVNQSEIFHPDTETFTEAATAATDRRYHSVALLQTDGTVLKAGSSGGFGNVRQDPPSNPCEKGYANRFDTDVDPENGNAPWMVVHTDAERYYPAYMWQPRPTIGKFAAELHYGEPFTLVASGGTLDDHRDATRVAVIRLGATTHGNDMDQRYVWLRTDRPQRTDEGCWSITVTPPTNPAAAPPGDYQLVVVDGAGTPSPARLVRVRAR